MLRLDHIAVGRSVVCREATGDNGATLDLPKSGRYDSPNRQQCGRLFRSEPSDLLRKASFN